MFRKSAPAPLALTTMVPVASGMVMMLLLVGSIIWKVVVRPSTVAPSKATACSPIIEPFTVIKSLLASPITTFPSKAALPILCKLATSAGPVLMEPNPATMDPELSAPTACNELATLVFVSS